MTGTFTIRIIAPSGVTWNDIIISNPAPQWADFKQWIGAKVAEEMEFCAKWMEAEKSEEEETA